MNFVNRVARLMRARKFSTSKTVGTAFLVASPLFTFLMTLPSTWAHVKEFYSPLISYVIGATSCFGWKDYVICFTLALLLLEMRRRRKFERYVARRFRWMETEIHLHWKVAPPESESLFDVIIDLLLDRFTDKLEEDLPRKFKQGKH